MYMNIANRFFKAGKNVIIKKAIQTSTSKHKNLNIYSHFASNTLSCATICFVTCTIVFIFRHERVLFNLVPQQLNKNGSSKCNHTFTKCLISANKWPFLSIEVAFLPAVNPKHKHRKKSEKWTFRAITLMDIWLLAAGCCCCFHSGLSNEWLGTTTYLISNYSLFPRIVKHVWKIPNPGWHAASPSSGRNVLDTQNWMSLFWKWAIQFLN